MRIQSRWLVLLAVVAGAGCTSTSTQTTTSHVGNGTSPTSPRFDNGYAPDVNAAATPQLSNTDPCAMRLHDLCGAFLMYWLDNGRLPERLQDLSALEGDEPLAFTCPASGLPYIYSPDGIQISSTKSRVIVYDAAPSHAGVRWAITMQEPAADKPLIAEVRPLPEDFFLLRPPTQQPMQDPRSQGNPSINGR